MAAQRKYPQELRDRAGRLWREAEPRPPIAQVARQLGIHPEALRNWIRQDEAGRGERHGRPATDMAGENRRLRRENSGLKRASEVLRAASAYFAPELAPARRWS